MEDESPRSIPVRIAIDGNEIVWRWDAKIGYWLEPPEGWQFRVGPDCPPGAAWAGSISTCDDPSDLVVTVRPKPKPKIPSESETRLAIATALEATDLPIDSDLLAGIIDGTFGKVPQSS
jgi:hypothetical protein